MYIRRWFIYLLKIEFFHSCVTLPVGFPQNMLVVYCHGWLLEGIYHNWYAGPFVFQRLQRHNLEHSKSHVTTLVQSSQRNIKHMENDGCDFTSFWGRLIWSRSTKSLPQRSQWLVAYKWDSGRIGCNPICKQQPQKLQWHDLGMLQISITWLFERSSLDFMSDRDRYSYCYLLLLCYPYCLLLLCYYDCCIPITY